MKLFFDTSALFKLYHKEKGTSELIDFFKNNAITAVYISEITEIEFSSAVWKKVRKGEINEDTARLIIEKFEKDSGKYSLITQNYQVRKKAAQLIAKYWKEGLRSLDSIQLASALNVGSSVDFFITSHDILSDIAIKEGFKTQI